MDLLSVARLLERHLLVRNLEPLLLPHPTPAPEQAGHDPFGTTFFFVERFLSSNHAPLPTAPLADDVALVLAARRFVEESQQLPPSFGARRSDGVLPLGQPRFPRGLVLPFRLDGVP